MEAGKPTLKPRLHRTGGFSLSAMSGILRRLLGPRDRDASSRRDLIQDICPVLHHAASVREILRRVVGTPNLVPLVMRKLPLNPIGIEPHLVEQGGGNRPEPMNRGPPMVAHAVHGV